MRKAAISTPEKKRRSMALNEQLRDEGDSALLSDAESCLINYGTKFMPYLITKASGVFIYTSDGKRILDWTSGQMSSMLGHGHPEIVETITHYATHLDHLFSGTLSPPVIQLARRLTHILPKGLDRAMFLSTGGESSEAGIKLAKTVTGNFEIVGLGQSWHGMTGTAIGAQYHSGRRGHGPLVPGNLSIPAPNSYHSIFRRPDGSHDWETELDYGWANVDSASCGSLAAVILEPILSSGGILPLPKGYLAAMKAHCEKRGMLLIMDEAQTGLGRTGDMFAFEHDGVVPDILLLSKTLGSGIPLSAVVTSHAIADKAKERGFLFYTTHVSDPMPCAVGLKVLEIVERDRLVERSREAGQRLHDGLRLLKSRYGCIGDVRGRGLFAGVEIVADRATKKPSADLGNALATKMLELGLSANISTMASFSGVFRIAPPVTISNEELDTGLRILEEAFRSTPESMPLYDEGEGRELRASM